MDRLLSIRSYFQYSSRWGNGAFPRPGALRNWAHFLRACLVTLAVAQMPSVVPPFHQYILPKDFLFCLIALLLVYSGSRNPRPASVALFDSIIICSLIYSAGLSVLRAQNQSFALRQLAMMIATYCMYKGSQEWASRGRRRHLMWSVVMMAAFAASTVLIEAYRLIPVAQVGHEFPVGTVGTRAQVGHLIALVLPAALFFSASYLSVARVLIFIVFGAALVLSGSPVSYVGSCLSVGTLFFLSLSLSRADTRKIIVRRLCLPIAALVVGLFLGWAVPNGIPLQDRSSLRDSIQAEAGSLRMIKSHLLFGVGPGNWSIHYPRFAKVGDPYYEPLARDPTPWNSGNDLLRFTAELGIIGLVLVATAAFILAYQVAMQLRSRSVRDQRLAAVAAATWVTTGITSVFGATLQHPIPLAAATILLAVTTAGKQPTMPSRFSMAATTGLSIGMIALSGVALATFGRHTLAAGLLVRDASSDNLRRAVAVDPSFYEAQMALAAALIERGDCSRAIYHAAAARQLRPNALAPAGMLDRCHGLQLGDVRGQ